jgi:hypothetical protein
VTTSHGDRPEGERGEKSHARKTAKPGWADGLRKLYDDVVSEPLPDSFSDLLKKLDRADDD